MLDTFGLVVIWWESPLRQDGKISRLPTTETEGTAPSLVQLCTFTAGYLLLISANQNKPTAEFGVRIAGLASRLLSMFGYSTGLL